MTRTSTDIVVTAAHCFCAKFDFDSESGEPDATKYFVRIGQIDNSKELNIVKVNKNGFIDDPYNRNYVDVLIKKIELRDPKYLKNNMCFDEYGGVDDLALVHLEGFILAPNTDMPHVKPACNYAAYKKIPVIIYS